MKRRVSFSILVCLMVLVLSACGEKGVEGAKTVKPSVDYDATDLTSMMSAVDTEMQNTITAVGEKTNEIVAFLEKTNKPADEKLKEISKYYDSVNDCSKNYYAVIEIISLDYYKCVAAGGLDDLDVWHSAMDEYDIKVEGALYDLIDAEWEKMYDLRDALEDAFDGEQYQTAFESYIDACMGMNDILYDFVLEFGDTFWNVWDGFDAGETDVELILKNAAKEGETE